MHTNNYARVIVRCFWWGMFCAAAGFILTIVPIDLGPVLAALVLVVGTLLVIRATYYLGRYEERESGGEQEWSLYDNDPDH